jgi:integrase
MFLHRGIFYVEIDGKRPSLKTRIESEVKREYAKVRKNYLAGKLAHLTGQCQTTFKEYKKEFLEWAEANQPRSTFRANRLALNKLSDHISESTTLDRISIKHLDLMVTACRKGKKVLSIASINNYIRHARASFKKAVEWKYIDRNPFAGAEELPGGSKDPAFLSGKQVSTFITSIKDLDLRRIVVAYLATGRRRSELLRLTKSDINLESGRYRVTLKGGKQKWFPINSMFRAILISCMKQEGEKIFPKYTHPDTISRYVKKALINAGFGHLRLHDLRHTFASLKAREGRTLKEIQELLGHEDIKATMIYTHLTEDYLAEIAEVNFGPVDLGD